MSDDHVRDLARDLATEFDFDRTDLEAALRNAVAVHEADLAEVRTGDRQAAQLELMLTLQKAMMCVRDSWMSAGSETRDSMQKFLGRTKVASAIDDRMAFLVEVFDGYAEHYRRRKGNPRRSRSTTPKSRNTSTARTENAESERPPSLEPLEEFAFLMRAFWRTQTNLPFGSVLQSDESQETWAVPQPKSRAIEFLSYAVSVTGVRYSFVNLQTVMKRLRKRP